MSANFSFGGFNVSFGGASPEVAIPVPVPTRPTSSLYEILVESQVPSNPHAFNAGITGVPQDYTIDRKSVFLAKVCGAGCIFGFFLPIVIIVPLLMFPVVETFTTNFPGQPPKTESSINGGLIFFVVFMALAFTAAGIFLVVSAVIRPRKIVFSVEERAVLIEYGCKAPEVVSFDDIDTPYVWVGNNDKEKHKLHFDLRIPRLNGGSEIGIELVGIEARFKCANGVSVKAEKNTRELIETAANICHILRFAKESHEPVALPLRLKFDLSMIEVILWKFRNALVVS